MNEPLGEEECSHSCTRRACEWCPGDLVYGTDAPVHVYPDRDLVEHDTDGGDCVCGPTTEPVPREDGSMGWLVVHHSLDGREAEEAS